MSKRETPELPETIAELALTLPESQEALMNFAIEYITAFPKAGDKSLAAQIFDGMIELFPDHVDAKLGHARVYLGMEDYPSAKEVFEELAESGIIEGYLGTAECFLRQENSVSALQTLDKIGKELNLTEEQLTHYYNLKIDSITRMKEATIGVPEERKTELYEAYAKVINLLDDNLIDEKLDYKIKLAIKRLNGLSDEFDETRLYYSAAKIVEDMDREKALDLYWHTFSLNPNHEDARSKIETLASELMQDQIDAKNYQGVKKYLNKLEHLQSRQLLQDEAKEIKIEPMPVASDKLIINQIMDLYYGITSETPVKERIKQLKRAVKIGEEHVDTNPAVIEKLLWLAKVDLGYTIRGGEGSDYLAAARIHFNAYRQHVSGYAPWGGQRRAASSNMAQSVDKQA